MTVPSTQDQRVLAKRTSNALERLDQVEKTIPQLISAINNSLGGLNQTVNAQGEVLEAVVSLLGKDVIEANIADRRLVRATEAMESEKAALEQLKEKGDLAVTEKVTEKSIIVGREFLADGTLRHPGRAQVAYMRVDPEFQGKLLDQAVGYVIELPKGGKFEIVELYEVVEKPDAPPEAAPVATPEEVKA